MQADLFKDIVPAIMQNKQRVITEENEKDYNGWVVNRALSFHRDCVLYANEMNRLPNTDALMQFDYLLNTIRAYKRPFQKWQKLEKNDDLEIVKEYYNCSNEKAKEALRLLTKEQIEFIKNELNEGGVQNRRK